MADCQLPLSSGVMKHLAICRLFGASNLEVLVEWNGVKFLRRHVLNFHSASDMGFAGGCGDPNVNGKPP